MTNTFEYTRAIEELDSSFVEGVYWNENTKALAVDLNNDVYVYDNVPFDVVNGFTTTDSPGSYYRTEVKTKFGPATHLGNFWDVEWDDVEVAKPVAAVGTPKDLTYSLSAVVDGSPVNVTNSGNAQAFDLSSAPVAAKSKHTVTFDVVDGASDKSYTTDASSVDDAKAALVEVAEMLGLEVVVRSVTVYFE